MGGQKSVLILILVLEQLFWKSAEGQEQNLQAAKIDGP
jgi:hypothetical protein